MLRVHRWNTIVLLEISIELDWLAQFCWGNEQSIEIQNEDTYLKQYFYKLNTFFPKKGDEMDRESEARLNKEKR